ncbi:cytochrome P450 [Streptomyces sp. NBC_00878]|uniref:cytochrome P450 n=1 Tax=Streptomyces sp. NBC_00878 TaxID=2975854 RepID=UPI0022519A1E|nr:cytochrome P450 [Streptomyces sp. NBC_00878]MCX4902753.1 cytochrome P450 [Streptomyces sp. NBC_00878]
MLTHPFRPVAGPHGLPLLGNLPAFGRDPLAFLERLRDDYGDAVTWSLGPMRILFLAHPERIAELLGADERRYETLDAGWAFKRLIGNSVMRSQGAEWRRKRSMVQLTVRPRQVRRYATAMVDCAAALADHWRDGSRVDVLRQMSLLSQRIVVRTLFGNDLGQQARALGDAMTQAGQGIGAELRGIGLFLPPWVRTHARRRLLAAVATIDNEIDRLIHARQAAGDGHGSAEDLLSRLLAAHDEEGRPLTTTQVRDEAVTLWIGGHETTSTALTWTWYLLSASAAHGLRPQRWDAGPEQTTPPHAWFPFGGGQRACLGARFALVETALVLATLAQRFHLDIEGDPTPTAGLQLQPATPLHATLRTR